MPKHLKACLSCIIPGLHFLPTVLNDIAAAEEIVSGYVVMLGKTGTRSTLTETLAVTV